MSVYNITGLHFRLNNMYIGKLLAIAAETFYVGSQQEGQQ